jgi:hypothetical protein
MVGTSPHLVGRTRASAASAASSLLDNVVQLKDLLSLIEIASLDGEAGLRIDPELLQQLAQRPELAAEVYGANRDALLGLIRSDATAHDMIASLLGASPSKSSSDS